MVVAGAIVRAVEEDGPGFAASGTIDRRAGVRQCSGQRRRNRGTMLKPGHGQAITGYLGDYAADMDHRTRSITSGPAAAATARGKSWPIIVVIFRRTATSSTLRWCARRQADSWTGMWAAWSAGLRGSDPGNQPPTGPRSHDLDAATLRHRGPCEEMSADDRRALRQAEALPILVRMKARFDEVRRTLRPRRNWPRRSTTCSTVGMPSSGIPGRQDSNRQERD